MINLIDRIFELYPVQPIYIKGLFCTLILYNSGFARLLSELDLWSELEYKNDECASDT